MANMWKLFIKQTVFLLVLTLAILFCSYVFGIVQGDPVITLDFDAHNERGECLVLEAEYADGSKMPFDIAERILKEKGRCKIILSEDDYTDRSDYSMGGRKKWGFFD